MRTLVALLATLLVLLGVGWATLTLARRSVEEGAAPVEERIPPGAVEAIDALLQGATGSSMGAENPRVARIFLGPDQDALAMAERLAALVKEQARLPEGSPEVSTYASRENSLDADLRIYLGKTPTHHLTLVGRATGARGETRPWVALVVAGLGEADAGPLLALRMPLNLAVVPGAPFSLRVAQDAVLGWKEVLIDLPADLEPEAALEALPRATAWLVDEGVPRLLPDPRMAVVQATGEVEPVAVREARAAGVPVLRASRDLERERVLGLAQGSGALVWVVPAAEGLEAARWLQARSELHPVYVSEMAEAQRQRPRASPP